MNQETFDQHPIAHDLINGVDFLLEGSVLEVVSDASTETVLYADMPIKVQMKVTYTEPGVKGDTATNTLKPATVESEQPYVFRCSSTKVKQLKSTLA